MIDGLTGSSAGSSGIDQAVDRAIGEVRELHVWSVCTAGTRAVWREFGDVVTVS
ncbi:hypothetical protein [Nocardia farcinica]|uniref:hypothetical protein n=1 Tax=Nocardia farcinica TaxID=37329 RepID=UPI002455A2F7|nr:hypothetical protein [Nocardia farcinica]